MVLIVIRSLLNLAVVAWLAGVAVGGQLTEPLAFVALLWGATAVLADKRSSIGLVAMDIACGGGALACALHQADLDGHIYWAACVMILSLGPALRSRRSSEQDGGPRDSTPGPQAS
jgi:hypothetical protein